MREYITIWDFIIAPAYLALIYVIARNIQRRHIAAKPFYRYYVSGMFAKIFGGIGVCLIYVYYYGGGDTTNYFIGASAMTNLLFRHPDVFVSIMVGNHTPENWLMFDAFTGWPPWYMWSDEKSFFVIKFSCLLVLLAGKSFVASTILLAWLSYTGVWRLFELYCERFKHNSKLLAIAILFMPSVVFWGSGLLKDTITFSATCWFTFAIYSLMVTRRNIIFSAVYIILSSFLLISIKPYIFIALMPGLIIWISYERITKIQSVFVKVIMLPMILVAAIVIISLVFSQVGDKFGVYSNFDKIMETAEITRSDLVREQYGTHNYDIGAIDPSVAGLLSKAPVAVTAALFRPFIWESENIVMLLSALENTFVLGLTCFLFFRYGPVKVMMAIAGNPLLLFAVSFSLFFAFAVGLTTANFGALVRYKIPAIPFFLSSLFVLYNQFRLQK